MNTAREIRKAARAQGSERITARALAQEVRKRRPKRMSHTEYARALETIGISNRSFCRLVIDVDESAGRRWLNGERSISGPVAAFLRLSLRLKLDGAKLHELAQNDYHPED